MSTSTGSQRFSTLVAALLVFVVILAAFLLVNAIATYFVTSDTARPGREVATVARPAPDVANADVEFIALPAPVKTYKPAVKKKLALPDAVQADDRQHVLQASRVEASDAPTTVTAVIDEETGRTEIYVREEPLPWLDLTPRGEAGAFFGLKRGEPAVRVTARQQLLQVKMLRIGAIASVDAPLNGGELDTFIGVGAWTTW